MKKLQSSRTKGVESINTSSLPDIIFMLLFFFMVTTVMREVDLKVCYTPPISNQTKKLMDKSLVSYIYIGVPTNAEKHGNITRIQLNDAFAEPNNIRDYIASVREPMIENDIDRLTVSLKIDRKTEMGIVTDVKQELRKASALKINYSSNDGDPIQALRR